MEMSRWPTSSKRSPRRSKPNRRRDRERAHSPLRPAIDAIEVDTTGLTIEQVVDRISALVPV